MGMTVGPTSWWARSNLSTNYFARICPVGTALPDGSRIFCKEGGRSWIVSPFSTQVGSQWTDGKYNGIDTPLTDVCCISEWTTLCTQLITCGFNPCDWFVPNSSQLQTSYNCRCNWDSFSVAGYWSSTEVGSNNANCVSFACNGGISNPSKTLACCVRAFRCVTY